LKPNNPNQELKKPSKKHTTQRVSFFFVPCTVAFGHGTKKNETQRINSVFLPKIAQFCQKRPFLDILDQKGGLEKIAVSLSRRESLALQTKADQGGGLEFLAFLCGRSLVPEPLSSILILELSYIYYIFQNNIYIYRARKFFFCFFS